MHFFIWRHKQHEPLLAYAENEHKISTNQVRNMQT